MPKSITRERAIALGLNRYRTGLPGIHEHYAERYVIGRNCVACVAFRNQHRADREEIRAYFRQWYARRRAQEKPVWPVTPEQRAQKAANAKLYREKNRDRLIAYNRGYYAANRERIKARRQMSGRG